VSVLSYLQRRASDAVLSGDEKASIDRSISTLQTRLDSWFGSDVKNHFRFGSSTRGTILPRSMDSRSDIDYMVVFAEGGKTPQTYLDRLRRFVERYYSTSEIYQSSPTIVLELNHIKFELVPATTGIFNSGYYIPDGSGGWQNTDPHGFSEELQEANRSNLNLLKPTIRLAKYWNACNGYVYDSYRFERWIKDRWFLFATNQTDYLFAVFDAIDLDDILTKWRKEKVERAKKIVKDVRAYLADDMPYTAEDEVKKLIPE